MIPNTQATLCSCIDVGIFGEQIDIGILPRRLTLAVWRADLHRQFGEEIDISTLGFWPGDLHWEFELKRRPLVRGLFVVLFYRDFS